MELSAWTLAFCAQRQNTLGFPQRTPWSGAEVNLRKPEPLMAITSPHTSAQLDGVQGAALGVMQEPIPDFKSFDNNWIRDPYFLSSDMKSDQ